MIVAVARAELYLPGLRSLKEKRRVLKSLVDRLHQRFRVSVAETGFHDLHQRAEVGLSLVSGDRRRAHDALEACHRLFEQQSGMELVDWNEDFLEDL